MSYSSEQLTQPAIALIKHLEGCRLDAYRDAVGVWTIGYGHTVGVRPSATITKSQAERFLRTDLNEAIDTVARCVKVPLSDNEFGALVSLVFNIGSSAFKASTCLRELNAGNRQAAADAMELFVKGRVRGRKRVLNGLVRRRRMERALFDRPDDLPPRDGVVNLAGEAVPLSNAAIYTEPHGVLHNFFDALRITPRRQPPPELRRKRNLRRSAVVIGAGAAVASSPTLSADTPSDILHALQTAWENFVNHGTIPFQAEITHWAHWAFTQLSALWHTLMTNSDLPSQTGVTHALDTLLTRAADIPWSAEAQSLIVKIHAFTNGHEPLVWLAAASSVVFVRMVMRRYIRRTLHRILV